MNLLHHRLVHRVARHCVGNVHRVGICVGPLGRVGTTFGNSCSLEAGVPCTSHNSQRRMHTCSMQCSATDSPAISMQEDEANTSTSASMPEQTARSSLWAGMVGGWPRETLDPGLYVVGTPIGNLGDITLRALSVLKSVSCVLAEDTRHSRKLLNFYGIRADMLSYHAHNEALRVEGVVQRLCAGEPMALVSDAGMPGISDPGHALIVAAIEAGVKVFPVPGPSAFVAALVASGLPTSTITFVGFLPPKQGARRTRLGELHGLQGTLAFYAPPHALVAILEDMAAVLGGGRRACIAREITKRHEEMWRSTLDIAVQEFTRREPRGEMCIVVEGSSEQVLQLPITGSFSVSTGGGHGVGEGASPEAVLHAQAVPLLTELMQSGIPMSAAAKQAAKQLGVSRKALYEIAMEVHKGLGQ